MPDPFVPSFWRLLALSFTTMADKQKKNDSGMRKAAKIFHPTPFMMYIVRKCAFLGVCPSIILPHPPRTLPQIIRMLSAPISIVNPISN